MTARIAIVGGGGGVGSSIAFNLLLRAEPFDVGARRRPLGDGALARDGPPAGRRRRAPRGSIARRRRWTTSPTPTWSSSRAAAPLTVNRSRMVYLTRQRGDPARGRRRAGRRLGRRRSSWSPTRSTRCARGSSRERGLDRAARARLHGQRQPAAAHGDRRARSASTPRRVEAWVLGEHGDALRAAARPRAGRRRAGRAGGRRSARAAEDFVRSWYIRHVALDSGRSSTWTRGHGIARMVAALHRARRRRAVARVGGAGRRVRRSTASRSSVPVTLGPGGVERVHEWELDRRGAGCARSRQPARRRSARRRSAPSHLASSTSSRYSMCACIAFSAAAALAPADGAQDRAVLGEDRVGVDATDDVRDQRRLAAPRGSRR